VVSGGVVGSGEQAQSPGQEVVANGDGRVFALVEELEMAGVDGQGLVDAAADEVAVADVLGPGVPVKVTSAAPASGLLSVTASGVQVPPMLLDVQDRK
jgi:hypothetical protein